MRFIGDPNDLYKEILNIVRSSNEYLYIVSPYIGFEKDNSSIIVFRNSFIDALHHNFYKIKDFLDYQGHIYLIPYLHSYISPYHLL